MYFKVIMAFPIHAAVCT